MPSNYDFSGNVTGWGSAWTALIMPLIAFAMVITDAVILHLVPAASWNTGFRVRAGKANAVYREIGLMVCLLSLEFALFALFFTIIEITARMDLVGTLTMLLIVVMTASIILCLVRASRKNKY